MQRYGPGTALIVVDVQNDFADPAGSLSVAGGDEIVPTINREIAMARGNGGARRRARRTGTRPARRTSPRTAASGRSTAWRTRGAPQLHPALALPGGGASGPQGRQRRGRLLGLHDARPDQRRDDRRPSSRPSCARAGVEQVVVVGLATDYCVKATALDAIGLGFETRVLADAIAAVDLEPGDGERAIEEMHDAGVIMWRTVMR